MNDPSLLQILGRRYLQRNKGGTDYNLANDRLSLLDEIIDVNRWRGVCEEARTASAAEVFGRGEPSLRERCEEYAQRADRELTMRLANCAPGIGEKQTHRENCRRWISR